MKTNKGLTVFGVILLVIIVAISIVVIEIVVDAPEIVKLHINTIMSIVAPTVVALLALLRIEQTRDDINNGPLKGQVKKAMQERAREYATNDEMEDRHER